MKPFNSETQFQSLTGRLQTGPEDLPIVCPVLFQSLTGRLQTGHLVRLRFTSLLFQSLTGRLQTCQLVYAFGLGFFVSIPHR